MTGRLICVVGPSGAGKDTLLAGAIAKRPKVIWAQRVITRPEQAGGEPFEGVTQEEFDRRRRAGQFAFWWWAHGLSYGVPLATVERVKLGRTVVFNGSRAALPDMRADYPELEVIVITAQAPTLAARLAERGREDRADIERRLSRADWPIPDSARVLSNDGSVADGIDRLLDLIDHPAIHPANRARS